MKIYPSRVQSSPVHFSKGLIYKINGRGDLLKAVSHKKPQNLSGLRARLRAELQLRLLLHLPEGALNLLGGPDASACFRKTVRIGTPANPERMLNG